LYENSGKTANVACCICGGGTRNNSPSTYPTETPTVSSVPSNSPTVLLSAEPSTEPTSVLSIVPTTASSTIPTSHLSTAPSVAPSKYPTALPSGEPSAYPSSTPTSSPTYLDWRKVGSDIDGEAAHDKFGRSVSLSDDGKTVAIGGHLNDGNGIYSGHVRIYQLDGGNWTKLGSDIDGEASGDQSGFSVSLSDDGETVAIGAHGNDGHGSQSGHVRIYQLRGGSWTQVGTDIDGEAGSDHSGWSVSLSDDGKTVAIGGLYNDGNGDRSGHTRVYQFIGGSWTKVGSDIDGEAAVDLSGWSVSLSADGKTVAIGALWNDGNGSDSGHTRVFEWIGGSWTQVGSDIDGEAEGDNSGYSVSLSADGKTVAIGAIENDGNGVSSGHVRIYSLKNLN